MLLTFKLNDDAAVASIPRIIQELSQGAARVEATQLAANRGDLFVYVQYEKQKQTHSGTCNDN